jgi:hypothetical protein
MTHSSRAITFRDWSAQQGGAQQGGARSSGGGGWQAWLQAHPQQLRVHGPFQRVYVDQVHAPLPEGEDRARAACPLAVLVGLDSTPDPGFRPPTNFLGAPGRGLRSMWGPWAGGRASVGGAYGCGWVGGDPGQSMRARGLGARWLAPRALPPP